MNTIIKGTILTSFLLLLFAGMGITASAQSGNRGHRGNINRRQENQQDRIAQGIKSGSLTAREAARLEHQETMIDRQEARFRQSGDGLSPKERAKLEKELNRESKNIYKQKHDGQGQKPPTP
ncbi:MAG: hypothetical protein JO053_16270 [Acidobacteria bacterium]|nr:hypothetical protein [Acidobacteriota bacterium]